MNNDYFSSQADTYRRFRPSYPERLIDFLSNELHNDSLIWDCATGNGQAAMQFDQRFKIVATDQSSSQLSHRSFSSNILYAQAKSEHAPFSDRSVSLVTVAQALHWFNFDAFYREVRRVLRPGGIIAAWTYSFLSASPQLGSDIDECVRSFYYGVVGGYWPPERRWVDQLYETIPFPFDNIQVPGFYLDLSWDLTELVGYLSSWSSVAQYIKANKTDPMPDLQRQLTQLWGDPQVKKTMKWKLGLRVGRNDQLNVA